MKKHILLLSAVSLVALSGLAQADAKQPVAQWTCADFLAVDETYQPIAVGLGEAV
ncbi:HdeA, partial [Pseudomonas fragi]|nr:HdeA [Pseudomonas sp. GC01]